MKLKLTTLLAVILTVGLVAGCDAGRLERLKNDKARCIEAGGVPVMSVWDTVVMKECVFAPERSN